MTDRSTPPHLPSGPTRLDAGPRLRTELARQKLFQGVPFEALGHAIARCTMREYRAGEVVLAPGRQNDTIYLVLDGALRVSVDQGGVTPQFVLGPGDCLGELSIIDGGEVSALVTAQGPCRLLLLPAIVLWNTLVTVPGVARNLLAILSRRLRSTNELMRRELQQIVRLEQLERELRAARDIQSSMLPQRFPLYPDRCDFECAGMMQPAREVAGDFYDVFLLDDRRLFFAIGDVSDKGMAAALFMARTVPLLRMEAMRRHSLAEVVANVNEALCDNNAMSMFVTLFCGVLDLGSGELAWVNCGHPPPALEAPGAPYAYLPVRQNLALGAMEGIEFEMQHLRLAPGSTLVLYTDGVTEAHDPAERLFGMPRLRDLLDRHARSPAMVLAHAVLYEVGAFSGGELQSDDIALLVVRYCGD